MSVDERGDLPAEFLDLVDAYCSDQIGVSGMEQLETDLRESVAARHYFVAYFQQHTEIHFAVRAERATEAVLERLASETREPADQTGPDRIPRRREWMRKGRWLGLAALVAASASILIALGWWLRRAPAPIPGDPAVENVAWLVNAQDCLWEDAGQSPGRDMRAGKELRLTCGLAEIEFDGGARVILQGPAGLRLLSGRSARLLQGSLTAHVPQRARGFTVLTPHNRVKDLGTEFGLSVDPRGAATVRVFKGEVVAYPTINDRDSEGVTIGKDQAARLDGRHVDRGTPDLDPEASHYVRAIKAPPIITPRTLRLDFTTPIPGTLLDIEGHGIGLTHRLPGTGSALPEYDSNLRLRPDRQALELTTTRSDLNTQDRMPTGEYLGVRLRDLGFTGLEDFEIRATIPSIPGLKVVGQFGLYAGTRSDQNIRGGLIRWPEPETYRLFLVNNSGGIDSDIYEVGLMTSGDDLRLALRRIGGRYSLVVDDLTRRSSSTLEIAHPAFLDSETDLHVGLFGANPQSDLTKTLTVRDLTVTVWMPQTGEQIAQARRPASAEPTLRH